MNKILELFMKEPEKEFHVRKVAKLTDRSPTTASFYLERFEKQGVLISEKKYNHLFFRANTKSQAFKQLKRSYNLENLYVSGLIDFLKTEFNNPEVIGVFGSFSQGEDTGKSDIDIFITSPLKKKIEVKKFEKELNRPIQIFVYSREDMEKMKVKNKELLNSVLNGIILEGYLEIFK